MTQSKANILVVERFAQQTAGDDGGAGRSGREHRHRRVGRNALRELLHREFAVILLDVHMPEMDGFETAALIRERKSLAHVPIIFVTAYGDDTYATQGYSLGAVDYILAPVVPEVLRAKVGVFVQLFRQQMLIKEQANQQVVLAQEQAARRTAEAANRMKDEFLAILSHELRTPLNAILGWIQLLKMGGASEADVENGLEVIERNARAQAKIIEDLLDVSRIISGKLQLDLRPMNVVEIIEDALSVVQAEAESKHIDVTRSFDAELPLVDADCTRLKQVVWNLLSNAVKFTPRDGHVVVTVRHAEARRRNQRPRFGRRYLARVSAIRLRSLPAGRRLDHAPPRRFGAGAGDRSSARGNARRPDRRHLRRRRPGSHFHRSIAGSRLADRPLAVEQNGHAKPAGTLGASYSLQGVRVLVVDDEQDARELVERVLTRCGAEVCVVGSTHEALRTLPEFHPHVLVSDIGLPCRDGYELIREIRATNVRRRNAGGGADGLCAPRRAADGVRCRLSSAPGQAGQRRGVDRFGSAAGAAGDRRQPRARPSPVSAAAEFLPTGAASPSAK